MPTIINTPVNEESTAVFPLRFYDESSALVIPNSIFWTLTDKAGTVINSRENVGISPPVSTHDLVLTGDDLQISSGYMLESEKRFVILNADYDSSAGTGLKLNDYISFDITNLSWVE